MTKVIVLLLILAVAGAMVWLLSGGSKKIGKPSRTRRPARTDSDTGTTASKLPSGSLSQLDKMRESGMFWGVSLQNPGCDASMELFGKDIPLGEAPNLPLPECNSIQCSCNWNGLKEKRHTTRRRHPDRRDGIRFDEKEKTDRRSHKDRRKTDSTWERRNF